MTGYSVYICPICGKERRSAIKDDLVYVFSYCFCEGTMEESRKIDKLYGTTTTYARNGGPS